MNFKMKMGLKNGFNFIIFNFNIRGNNVMQDMQGIIIVLFILTQMIEEKTIEMVIPKPRSFRYKCK